MINLLQEKLEEVEKLKTHTKKILSLSSKTDFEKINVMIENRQKYMKNIDLINDKIEKNKQEQGYSDDSLITKKIKDDIRESIEQIIEMDAKIRKNTNEELSSTKELLNQPIYIPKLNLKA